MVIFVKAWRAATPALGFESSTCLAFIQKNDYYDHNTAGLEGVRG
jgi:hypothetical protein